MKKLDKYEIEKLHDTFVVVSWPEIQDYMMWPDFDDNSQFISADRLYDEYGDMSYFVRLSWIKLHENEEITQD